MLMIKFIIFIGKDNLYHWHMKGANGEIVCWGEGYSTEQHAITAINWVKKNAFSALIYK